jgi:D-glycero-D-manno-heptose 1,7-bisphosphate phosphatase
MMTPALFLDRDGVINVDKTYVFRFEDIEWMPGIFDIVKWANEKKWKVIVLTNQSGIGRGYYTEKDVITLHQKMSDFFQTKGLYIDDWFYSESLTDVKRKPSPLMMIEAKEKYNLDLKKSIMIGDKLSDLIELQGPEYLLVKGHYPLEDCPDTVKIFESLPDILTYLKEIEGK